MNEPLCWDALRGAAAGGCGRTQAAYLQHLLACPACTDVHRLPGLSRCAAGAVAWRAYVAALPAPIDYTRRRAQKGQTPD